MRVFITGGTGTLGKELVKQLYDTSERIVIYSRDELKQSEMMKVWPEYPDNKMRYMIGDVRNLSRTTQAMRGCDVVYHTAALKQVPMCEYNPQETIETNVIGTRNVIEACNAAGIKKCIVVSTDKACEPINLYGATKLCGEKMAIASNNLGACRFSVVRYGNVYGSRGSVVPTWEKQFEETGEITVTDSGMTRFWITIEEAALFIISRMKIMEGGEVFIPKMRHCTMEAFAHEVVPGARIKTIGIRAGEKINETLIGEGDARDCWKLSDGFTCYPVFHEWIVAFNYLGINLGPDFRYRSNDYDL